MEKGQDLHDLFCGKDDSSVASCQVNIRFSHLPCSKQSTVQCHT